MTKNNKRPARHASQGDAGGGFIQMILLIVGALVLIKYIYNIDVIGFLTTGKFREWLDKLYQISALGWDYFINFIKNIFK